jgi:hypothetical protein
LPRFLERPIFIFHPAAELRRELFQRPLGADERIGFVYRGVPQRRRLQAVG